MYSHQKNKIIYDCNDIMFKTPFTLNIIGPSKCGKTSLVLDLLEHNSIMMTPAPQKIIYCYSLYQQLFDYLREKVKVI